MCTRNPLIRACVLAAGLCAHGAAVAHPGHPGAALVLDEPAGQSTSLAVRLDQLAKAQTPQSAKKLAADIRAAWLDMGGDAVDVLMDRAIEAVNGSDLDLGRELFDRIILIDPDYAEVWYQRALVFLRTKKPVEAIFDLEQAVKREPRHFAAWQTLGEILESIGQRAAALDAYRRTLALHPFATSAERGQKRLIPLVEGRSL